MMLDMDKGRGVIAGIVLVGLGIAGLVIATRGGAFRTGTAAPRAGEAAPTGAPVPAGATAPALPVDPRFPPAVPPPPPLSPDEMQRSTGGATAYPGASLDGYPTPVDPDPTGGSDSNDPPGTQGTPDAAVVEVPTTVDAQTLASLYERLGVTELRRVGTRSRILLPDGMDVARVERELAGLAAPR